MLCQDVVSVLTDAAHHSLRRVKINKRRNPQAKWYTSNLHILKCQVLSVAKLLQQRYPRDPYIRGKFVMNKKQYKQACRTAKHSYIKMLSQELDTLEVKTRRNFGVF
jgi:hypothetical protein